MLRLNYIQKLLSSTHIKNSNTTNVKVKLGVLKISLKRSIYSNTTNVKVKLLTSFSTISLLINIQIQPMLRLNIV